MSPDLGTFDPDAAPEPNGTLYFLDGSPTLILPMESALTVLVWGNRIAPVRITSVEITEDAFDPQLNPIRAKVTLSLRVLNVVDAGFINPAGSLYMAYQIGKEALAASNTGQTMASLGLGALP